MALPNPNFNPPQYCQERGVKEPSQAQARKGPVNISVYEDIYTVLL